MPRAKAEEVADRADRDEERAEIAQEAEEKKLDETVPGGRYKVGTQLVNANGEPIKK